MHELLRLGMTRRVPQRGAARSALQRGFTLVELMVSMALGLLLLTGLVTVFVNNQRTRSEMEKTNRQTENGRYAIQMIGNELRHAGYYSEFDPSKLPLPAAMPDACAVDLDDLRDALPLGIQGEDQGSALFACLADVRAGTDVLAVRRVNTCALGDPNCDPAQAGIPYFQAALCGQATELASPTVTDHYVLDNDAAKFVKRERDCTTAARVRRYRVHIYYVANNNKAGDGVPTLKRAELGPGGFQVVPLVEGIENLQVQYGLDQDGDSAPEVYTTDPTTFGGCAGTDCISNWRDVTAVKLALLARNTEQSADWTDDRAYRLGTLDDGSDNLVGPFGDKYRRHAYTTVVRLNNVAGRRE
ncbi:MAG: PilW family protein [Burkholderiales bacterium]|nr:MAG: PilW family protein [Burkholderiales bacterium]